MAKPLYTTRAVKTRSRGPELRTREPRQQGLKYDEKLGLLFVFWRKVKVKPKRTKQT